MPVPEGLDLDAWINELSDSSDSESETETAENLFVKGERTETTKRDEYKPEPTEEELTKVRETRKFEQQNNPHYLKGVLKKSERNGNYENVESIPVAEIDLSVPLKVVGQKRSDKYLTVQPEKKKVKKTKKKREKTVKSSDEENEADSAPSQLVNQNFEMPEGARLSEDSDDGRTNLDDPHRALDIDLEL